MSIEEINKIYPVSLVDIADDDNDDISLVEELLDKVGIRNRRKFKSLDEYEQALLENPKITPQLAFIDYRPAHGSELNGMHITVMLVKRTASKSLATKVFMLSGLYDAKVVRKFFRNGGWDWLDKNDPNYKDDFIDSVMDAIVEIERALEERALLDELDED